MLDKQIPISNMFRSKLLLVLRFLGLSILLGFLYSQLNAGDSVQGSDLRKKSLIINKQSQD